jgi:hypothetical protein
LGSGGGVLIEMSASACLDELFTLLENWLIGSVE